MPKYQSGGDQFSPITRVLNDVPDSTTESSFDSDCESELVSELTDEKIIIKAKSLHVGHLPTTSVIEEVAFDL